MSNNNTIHLGIMPIANVENILSGFQKRINNISSNLQTEYSSYAELLQAAKDQIASNEKSTADMTMEEYKEYISDKLQSMRRDFTRYQDDETIIISDAGFEAMKNDSEYEAWVLDVVQDNLMTPNYLFGWKNSARISVHQFGATKEEYRGQSYSADRGNNLHNDEEEDFWTQRSKRMKKILEM